jgi:hypothetical protein
MIDDTFIKAKLLIREREDAIQYLMNQINPAKSGSSAEEVHI